MNNEILNLQILNTYNNALATKTHFLHKIVKKINKKTLDNYFLDYKNGLKGNWPSAYGYVEHITSNSNLFFENVKIYGEDFNYSHNKNFVFEKILFGNEGIGVYVNTKNNNAYYVEGVSNSYNEKDPQNFSFIRKLNCTPYDYGYCETSNIKNEIEYFVFNNQNNIIRLFEHIITKSLIEGIGYTDINKYYQRQINNLIELFKNSELDETLLNNYYGLKLIDLSQSDIYLGEVFKISPEDKRNLELEEVKDKVLINGFNNIRGNFNILFGKEINDEELLNIFHLVDFFKYYEVFDIYSQNLFEELNNFDLMLDKKIIQKNNIAENPLFLINKFLNKINPSLSITKLTSEIYKHVYSGYHDSNINKTFYTYRNTEDETSQNLKELLTDIKTDKDLDKSKLFYSIGYYNGDTVIYTFKDIFAEIFFPIVEEKICNIYNIQNFKNLKEYIFNLQFNELQNAVNQGYIEENVLKELLYNYQGSFLKLEKIIILENAIQFYINKDTSFTINYNNLNINNSYTTGIKTSSENNNIVMEGSIKLSNIIIGDDGLLDISLSNKKFTITTKSYQFLLI